MKGRLRQHIDARNKHLLTQNDEGVDTLGEARALMFPTLFNVWTGVLQPYFMVVDEK